MSAGCEPPASGGSSVTPWDETVRVAVGKVSLELPAALVKSGDAAIDSAANVFEAAGLRVTVDQGPFVSRLESHIGRPGYKEGVKDVGGAKGRTIFFRSDDGAAYTMAVHVPAPNYVTVVVRADASVSEAIPRAILDSLQLLN